MSSNNLISEAEKLEIEKLLEEDGNELELRFGEYQVSNKFTTGKDSKERAEAKKKFVSGVTRDVFEQALTEKNVKKGPETSIIWLTNNIYQGIRMITKLDINGNKKSSQIERKIRLGVINFPALGMRLSYNKEEEIDDLPQSTKFSSFRYRVRQSVIDGEWRWDFTKVITRSFNNTRDAKEKIDLIKKGNEEWDSYEIEIEWVGDVKSVNSEIVIGAISKTVVLINKDAVQSKLRIKIYSDIKNLLSNTYSIKTKSAYALDFTRDFVNKPKTLQRRNLTLLDVNKYGVTIKADGERALLFVNEKGEGYLINSQNVVKEFDMGKGYKGVKTNNTLFDGELIENKTLYAFDVLVCDGFDIRKQKLPDRLACLEKTIKKLKSDNVKLKKMELVEGKKSASISAKVNKVLDAKYPYETDGLIFTPVDLEYRNDKIFKWKSIKMTTVDFLIRRSDRLSKGMTEYHLYVGIQRALFEKLELKKLDNYDRLFEGNKDRINFFPIHFSPEFMPDLYKWIVKDSEVPEVRDNIIVELSYTGGKKGWEFVRVREDKTGMYRAGQSIYGNSWETAESNMDAVLNPIEEDVIRGKKKLSLPFFTESGKSEKSSNISAMRQFHNTIKSAMYKEYASGKKLLEVGAGRFGDLRKWIKYNVKEVTAIDADADAIEEGLKRAEEMRMTGHKVPKITTKVVDATKSKWDIEGRNSYDCIAIMFAVHFFLGSDVVLKRFIKNCQKYLKPGGTIMMTTMDGKRVYDMLAKAGTKKGETYDLKNKKGETVFSFRQECFCENFSDWGQEVSVYVESIGNFNKEYLVNFDYMCREFEAAGFEIVSETGFEEFYKQRKSRDKKLSEVEKKFSFLNKSLIIHLPQ